MTLHDPATDNPLITRADLPATEPQLECDSLELFRLIVLVPAGINSSHLARRIWTLAQPCCLHVLYVSLCEHDQALEGGLRLRLATLAAMTRDDQVDVATHICECGDWLRAVHEVWRPGDAVICMAEHQLVLRHQGSAPLSHVLEMLLNVPVYVLPGLYHEAPKPPVLDPERVRWMLRSLGFMAGLLFIVGVFFFIQIRIDQGTSGFVHGVLLAVSGLAEVGLACVWSGMLS